MKYPLMLRTRHKKSNFPIFCQYQKKLLCNYLPQIDIFDYNNNNNNNNNNNDKKNNQGIIIITIIIIIIIKRILVLLAQIPGYIGSA